MSGLSSPASRLVISSKGFNEMRKQSPLAWCRWMPRIFAAALSIWVIVAPVGRAVAAETEEALFAVAEKKIKPIYDKALDAGAWKKIYEEHAEEFRRDNGDGHVPGNWLDHASASDWLKAYYYNMANVIVTCAIESGVTASDLEKQQGEAYAGKFNPCFARRVAQMNLFINIDNKVMAFSRDKFSRECEPVARLVARERRLPPFSYLKADNPDSMRLIAFGVYLKCFADHGMPVPARFVD